MRKKEIVCFGDVHLSNLTKSEWDKQYLKLKEKIRKDGFLYNFAFTVTDTPLKLDNKVDNVSR